MPYKNKEDKAAYMKQYKNPNKAKHQKKYGESPTGKKFYTLKNWKKRGINDDDIDSVYDYYLLQTNCMICNKEFKNSRDRHLDHDHDTGEIRYICCNFCNSHVVG